MLVGRGPAKGQPGAGRPPKGAPTDKQAKQAESLFLKNGFVLPFRKHQKADARDEAAKQKHKTPVLDAQEEQEG